MNYTIGLKFTPSTMIKSTEITATEITISCGGGMGGSLWEEYTTDEVDLTKQFITVNTNRNRNTSINTNFIVKTRPIKLVKVSLRNDGNGSMYQHSVGTIKDYYYAFDEDDIVAIDPKNYGDKCNSKLIDVHNKNF